YMKINELNTKSNGIEECELLQKCKQLGGVTVDWAKILRGFDFESEGEIIEAVVYIAEVAQVDNFISQKKNRDFDAFADNIYRQVKHKTGRAGELQKFASVVAAECWNNHFAPLELSKKIAERFNVERDKEKFNSAAATLKKVFNLNTVDVDKLKWFAIQCREGAKFPSKQRMMLYLCGEMNETGKTTLAEMFAAALNGMDWEEDDTAPLYATLDNELQFERFAIPKIVKYRCCVADEIFFKDMGKSYPKFKTFLTKNGGTYEVKFGGTFNWTGYPNYFATSNYPLTNFIQDMQDRRFLEIKLEKKSNKIKLSELWRSVLDFCINAERECSWADERERLGYDLITIGTRAVEVAEFEIFLRQQFFLQALRDLPQDLFSTGNSNRITVAKIISILERNGVKCDKKRFEIERAAINVFGQKYNERLGFWILPEMIKTLDNSDLNIGVENSDEQETTDFLF
ncbi:MAG TPA: hypothetical protein P5215_04095, partial [Bacteroidales bacterium]|nr:hypothetical protein [Bacteroidales bacterium]